MPYQTLDQVNQSEGLQTLLIYTNNITSGLFMSLILFCFFLIIWIGGYNSSKRLTGRSDIAMYFMFAGFSTTIVAVVMSLISGLINRYVVISCVIISCLGALWYFTARE